MHIKPALNHAQSVHDGSGAAWSSVQRRLGGQDIRRPVAALPPNLGAGRAQTFVKRNGMAVHVVKSMPIWCAASARDGAVRLKGW